MAARFHSGLGAGSHPSEAHLEPEDEARMPPQRRVLMARPDHYEVSYAINPHMSDPAGDLHVVDPDHADDQWSRLKRAYQQLGIEPVVVPPAPQLPDLVFTANQVFPFLAADDPKTRCFISARMAHQERRAEVPLVASVLETEGYHVRPLPRELQGSCEGGGDLLWWPRRRFIVAGNGPRTSPAATAAASRLMEAPMLVVDLVDPRFYHLDTCLAMLDAGRALWVPAAFDAPGQAALRDLFYELIEVPRDEAETGLAANAHCPDGKRVLLDRQNRETIRLLDAAGFDPIGIDTSEFRKSGGSVFCMKTMLW